MLRLARALLGGFALLGPMLLAPPADAHITGRTAASATVDVRAYFLHGESLAVVHRRLPSTPRIATAALRALLAGPTASERALGLVTAVPSGTALRSVSIASGVATVDLSRRYESGGGSLSMQARLAQVTYTATQFSTVRRVTFEIDGARVTVFGGEGILLEHPVGRATFASFRPAIFVESPGWGAVAHDPLVVTGSADVFEAQFDVELRTASGRLLARASVRASSGSGVRGSFKVSLPFAVSGPVPAVVTVFDRSPKDGQRIDVVKVPLRLAP